MCCLRHDGLPAHLAGHDGLDRVGHRFRLANALDRILSGCVGGVACRHGSFFLEPGLALAVTGALAQDYPVRPIRYIVPNTPGVIVDTVARVLAPEMSKVLGQSVVIENKPGALGNIASEYVARSKPDGYTIMSADNAVLAFNEHLFSKLPFSPEKDFTYVGGISRTVNYKGFLFDIGGHRFFSKSERVMRRRA